MIKKIAGIATIVVVIFVIAIGITRANPVKVGFHKTNQHFVASVVKKDGMDKMFVKASKVVTKNSVFAKVVKKEESKDLAVFDVKGDLKGADVAAVKFSDMDDVKDDTSFTSKVTEV